MSLQDTSIVESDIEEIRIQIDDLVSLGLLCYAYYASSAKRECLRGWSSHHTVNKMCVSGMGWEIFLTAESDDRKALKDFLSATNGDLDLCDEVS